ncbi:alpha-L-rhamnosidase [Opitutaceae bacterium EW11]|nr:alpha-L-rhamnosidase [Opitutaceae bacterium EW11]
MAETSAVVGLRCEYLVDPLGIDERSPRLSWRLETGRRGARQAACRIRVASTAEKLASGDADRWDSGRVAGSATTHVVYQGRALEAREACHWDVEVWDETGAAIRSRPALWTMGLLAPEDWSASWIGVDPEVYRRDPDSIEPTLTEPGSAGMFRREFDLPPAVLRATLYATSRGVFELRLNGGRISADIFAPEWTDYFKRIHYRTYDVTQLLLPGRNALGVLLGDGWWSGYVGWQETRGRYGSLENSVCLQLEIELADGRRMTVATDPTWRCSTGPILSSDFMMGERYDARRERTGWDRAAFDDATWLPARAVEAPSAPRVFQPSEPVRITETLKPVSAREVCPGVWIYDLGQNITGWVRLRMSSLPAGTRLVLRHGERLNPDGTLYTENLRRAKATDTYVARGAILEVFEPHFTFHGFQYVELTGFPGTPPEGTVTGCVVHSANAETGRFECSHAGINRLWLNGAWSQRDNFLSVPTDCPQRDERLGWMGDAQVFLRTASYNRDVAGFFTKWMIDVEDAQTPEGVFPDVAPRLHQGLGFVGLDDLCGAAGWADAGVIVPWTIWRVYGDRRIVERHWRAMTSWLDYLERTNPDGLRTRDLRNNYGDWLCIPTDTSFRTHSPMKNLLATAYWADDAAKVARMARELGREAEAGRFTAMFEHVRSAFIREFVRDDGTLTVETQTAYLLALAFDLVPHSLRTRVAEHLVANIRELGWHLSTGFIGISHLNPVLTLSGHADVAYRLLQQETYPSWLYPVLHGATTIWERWNGWTEADGFFDPQMNSFNHYSLGSVGEWLFRHVAGIELDPDVCGFQRFVLRPFTGSGLSFAKARYRTMHGDIESHWRRAGRELTWDVVVPPNTTARVYVPAHAGSLVTESGGPLESALGVDSVADTADFRACEVVAGEYHFRSVIGA